MLMSAFQAVAGARLISRLFAPTSLAIAIPIVIGWHARGGVGAAWGLVPATFTGLLPLLHSRWLARRPQSSRRGKGLPQTLTALACLITGLFILIIGGAPNQVLAAGAAFLAVLIGIMPITARWDISIHAATTAGSAAMLAIALQAHPYLVLAMVGAVAAVAWSRVQLEQHTPAQVLAGAALGMLACGAVYSSIA
ncbi:phosphatase PAP2 family protein [Nonomuraea sp. NPDC023979]|uniref:phosphatase PAP2 family protein n=1 Tax=Nonomuraea sp. NPDC023979 TaxID=3154796 RepID=UPI0033CC8E8B